MYSGCDYLLSKVFFVYFLALPSLLHPSILFNCFYTCIIIHQWHHLVFIWHKQPPRHSLNYQLGQLYYSQLHHLWPTARKGTIWDFMFVMCVACTSMHRAYCKCICSLLMLVLICYYINFVESKLDTVVTKIDCFILAWMAGPFSYSRSHKFCSRSQKLSNYNMDYVVQ